MRFEFSGVFLLRYLLHLPSSQVNVNITSPLEDEMSGEGQFHLHNILALISSLKKQRHDQFLAPQA